MSSMAPMSIKLAACHGVIKNRNQWGLGLFRMLSKNPPAHTRGCMCGPQPAVLLQRPSACPYPMAACHQLPHEGCLQVLLSIAMTHVARQPMNMARRLSGSYISNGIIESTKICTMCSTSEAPTTKITRHDFGLKLCETHQRPDQHGDSDSTFFCSSSQLFPVS